MASLDNYTVGLARTFSKLPQGALIIDQQRRITYANASALKLFGYSEEALIGSDACRLVEPKRRAPMRRAVAKLIQVPDAPGQTLYSSIIKRNRSAEFAHITLVQLYTNDNEIHVYVRIDTAQTKSTPTQLVDEQLAMASLGAEAINALNTLDDPIVILDSQWRYQYVNAAGWKILRKSKEEILGKVVWDMFPQLLEADYYQFAMQAMAQQKQLSLEEYYPFMRQWYRTKFYPSAHALLMHMHNITDVVETRNINRQLTGSLEQAMAVYWSDKNRPKREAKQHDANT